jgi:predicted GIY-YIG superfamily endonuclease
MEKLWFNYFIVNSIKQFNKTYIGSTNNIDRRIRQHNGEIKGGARYTRGNTWLFYSIIYSFNLTKNLVLSREWYFKYIRRKYRLYCHKLCNKGRNEQTVSKIIEYFFTKKQKIAKSKIKIKYKKYSNIIFILRKNAKSIPLLSSNHVIIILDNLNSNIILSFIKTIKMLRNSSYLMAHNHVYR